MFKTSVWPAALLAATCTCAVPLRAAEPFVTAKVVFENPGPYAQADLEAAAGVHAGDRVTLAGIKAAAQRLVATQTFSGVTMDSKGAPEALTLVFILKPLPTEEMLPVGFENFVWLTPAELLATVHKSAPLFQGRIPAGSNETDAIVAGLQASLAAKGVPAASVTYDEVQPTTAEPVHAIQFRVAKPAVTVDRIELAGAGPLVAAVDRIATKLRGAPYAQGYAADGLERVLLQPYLDAGYLDARLADTGVAVGPGTAEHVGVTLTGRVEPGEVYRVGALKFAPTPVLSESAFAAGTKLHAGEVASRKQLLASVATIDAAYEKQGFVDEYVDTHPVLDGVTHTVNYDLGVVPGEPYRLHAVVVENLPPPARAQFDVAWAMKPGDPYDAGYVRSFLGNNTAMRGLAGYTGTFQAASDPSTHTVDLRVIFFPTSGRS